MAKSLDTLIAECRDLLNDREYRPEYQGLIMMTWEDLNTWMDSNGIIEFSEDVGFLYADVTFGGHILTDNIPKKYRVPLRAVRMLTSYQKYGDFEFRTPSCEKNFSGEIGAIIEKYLEWMYYEGHRAEATINNRKFYLWDFCEYLNALKLHLSDISAYIISDFFISKKYSLATSHNCRTCLRCFFHYLADNNITEIDFSAYVGNDAYRKNNKLPTTYTEAEIKQILESVERGSAKGKRDYLILLLAAEYGWRAGDIRNFTFDQIDWDHNVIRFYQTKTGVPVEYPLLASVGNAIIDYLKHGRPDTNAKEIIVSHNFTTWGQPLTSPTLHSVVAHYMRAANIKDWSTKRHGPHSLRHSLATNLLKRNISLPVISTVLGHQTTETTKIYLKVDFDKLVECALAMPEVNSPYYQGDKWYE